MKTIISFMTYTNVSLQDHWCNRTLFTDSRPMATSRGSPTELGKHPSNENTRTKNGGAHVNNVSERNKLMTLNVL